MIRSNYPSCLSCLWTHVTISVLHSTFLTFQYHTRVTWCLSSCEFVNVMQCLTGTFWFNCPLTSLTLLILIFDPPYSWASGHLGEPWTQALEIFQLPAWPGISVLVPYLQSAEAYLTTCSLLAKVLFMPKQASHLFHTLCQLWTSPLCCRTLLQCF